MTQFDRIETNAPIKAAQATQAGECVTLGDDMKIPQEYVPNSSTSSSLGERPLSELLSLVDGGLYAVVMNTPFSSGEGINSRNLTVVFTATMEYPQMQEPRYSVPDYTSTANGGTVSFVKINLSGLAVQYVNSATLKEGAFTEGSKVYITEQNLEDYFKKVIRLA